MMIAPLLFALLATTAADTTGDPVLLDFQATWCGPCQQMRPAVEKLVQMGYPVKKIDYDRSPELIERYKVRAVPTFIVVDAKGKELARTQGVLPPAELAAFYNETKLKTFAAGPAEEAQERAPREEEPSEGRDAPSPANPRPWETVVRIKMHLTDSEWGFGSGTIIYSSAEESIILTCAHIFKVRNQPSPKNFRVPISVDLFDGQFVRRQPAMLSCSEKDLPGEAIDYDFANDVGRIRIRPGRKLPSSPVVPATWKPRQGMPMITVGCSHGQDATAWDTKILDPRVGMSNTTTKQPFATIKCAHEPKQGRSGGGLYTSDGYVAGVCDFADPNEHVGLYAVPEAIHRLLDRNQLTALYKPPTNGGDVMLASNRSRSKASGGTKYRAQNPDESANAEDVTLPPPSMVGINNPTPDPHAGWARKSGRSPARDDSGSRRGLALTDHSEDPGPEARALEDDEPTEAPSPKRVEKPSTTAKPGTSGWHPVRQDSDGSRPSSR